MSLYDLGELMNQARRLAADYRRATGKPMPGVSAELAVYDAIRLMDLEPASKEASFDAVDKAGRHYQIKGRVIFDEAKRGQRLGELRVNQPWDAVLLVLLNADYQPTEIHLAERADVLEALEGREGSSRRSRGTLSVVRFTNLGQRVWTPESGLSGEVWANQP